MLQGDVLSNGKDAVLGQLGDRVDVVRTPTGGFTCLPKAAVTFLAAVQETGQTFMSAAPHRPQRVRIEPNGLVSWGSEKISEIPSLFSLSGIVFDPNAEWTFGSDYSECRPISQPADPSSHAQSNIKVCNLMKVQTSIPDKEHEGSLKHFEANCKVYKRLVCFKNKEGRKQCLQQKEGRCIDGTAKEKVHDPDCKWDGVTKSYKNYKTAASCTLFDTRKAACSPQYCSNPLVNL